MQCMFILNAWQKMWEHFNCFYLIFQDYQHLRKF